MSDWWARLKALGGSRLGLVLRVAISLALFSWIVSRIDLQLALESLAQVRWPWIGGTLAIYVTAELISGLRWQLLLRAQGSDVPLRALLKALVVGRFFNQFMVSTIGGDTARFWQSSKLTGKPVGAGVVLVADRLIGLIALFLVAAAAAIAGTQLLAELKAWRWAALSGAVAGLAALAILTRPAAGRFLEAHTPASLRKVAAVLIELQRQPAALRAALLLSLLLQIVVVFRYLTLARAVGIELSVLALALIVPIALLVLAVPITINGLGLREVTFVALLGIWGVSAHHGAAFAWLDLAFGMAVALVGGLLFLWRR